MKIMIFFGQLLSDFYSEQKKIKLVYFIEFGFSTNFERLIETVESHNSLLDIETAKDITLVRHRLRTISEFLFELRMTMACGAHHGLI